MSLRPSRNPSALSIRPPSPAAVNPPTITTPTNQMSSIQGSQSLSSPRRPGPPISPSQSGQGIWSQGTSNQGTPWTGSPYASEDRLRGNSLDVPQLPILGLRDKRLPAPPWITPHSPHRNKSHAAGAYDNKLVTSTLSHLPPLPSPTGPTTPTLLHPRPTSPRPSISTVNSSVSSIGVVLPDGTTLSRDTDRSARSVADTLAHSSPSSPWSVLTVHVLPLFAGGHLRTPLEDLNHLCHSHIIATSQRTPSSRIVSVLTQDLRDFIASGMLTLKAKFETLEEAKVISRAAEVWSFFWSQILPYLEGVFLPLNQVRDIPSTSTSSITIQSPPIPVRHLLLSGFMLHILLPLLPRLLPLISSSSLPPSVPELQRILQMSLVISTQARYSSIFPTRERQDEEVRDNVESLGRAVRWRIQHGDPAEQPDPPPRVSRGLSLSGRRRKGVRSSAFPRELGFPEMDEDDDPTPNQSYAGGAQSEWPSVATQSTVIA